MVGRCVKVFSTTSCIGWHIFNRRTWLKVPTENRGFRRQPRLNPEAEWIIPPASATCAIEQVL